MFKSPFQKIEARAQKALEYRDIEKFKAALEAAVAIIDVPKSKYFAGFLGRVASRNFTEGLRYLLENGADATVTPSSWSTPLHVFAEHNNVAAVTMLLEAGAPVDARRYGNNTPLHLAAKKGYGEVIRALMAHGADLEARDEHMNTPADVAEKDFPRIADMIRGRLPGHKLLEAEAPEWTLTSPEEVARVSVKQGIGYRITEIFNFNAGLYTQIARNIETNAESQSVKALATLDERFVAMARDALASLGGVAIDVAEKKKLMVPRRP